MTSELEEHLSCAAEGNLSPADGGALVDLLASPNRAVELQLESERWPSWELAPRQLCDLDLLMNGALIAVITRVHAAR